MKSALARIATLTTIAITCLVARASVPTPLAVLLTEYGCAEFEEGTELMRINKRWWFSLEPHTGVASDYLFYCQTKGNPLSVRLVIHAKGNNPWGGCNQTVESWKIVGRPWLPLDLEVVDTSSRYSSISDLGRWRLVREPVDAPIIYGPAGVQAPRLAIDTSAQDTGAVFVCHSGSWYRHVVH